MHLIYMYLSRMKHWLWLNAKREILYKTVQNSIVKGHYDPAQLTQSHRYGLLTLQLCQFAIPLRKRLGRLVEHTIHSLESTLEPYPPLLPPALFFNTLCLLMSAEAAVPKRDLAFFLQITDSFKKSAASAKDGNAKNMEVTPFLEAMTMFLRIFDAFSNKIFTEVVKKDVQGNINKFEAAAKATGGNTIDEVIEKEMSDPAYAKLIKKETGKGQSAGTVALLWMKRTMQFVCGMLKLLIEDTSTTLSSASRKSYGETLSFCHNFITRGTFDTGLRFAPSRETFYANLTGGQDVDKVDGAMKDFVTVFQPQLDGIVDLYKSRGLEPYIK